MGIALREGHVSTAVMFSRIDALERPRLRSLVAQIPHVRTRLRQVERISLDAGMKVDHLVIDLVGQEWWSAGPRVRA